MPGNLGPHVLGLDGDLNRLVHAVRELHNNTNPSHHGEDRRTQP